MQEVKRDHLNLVQIAKSQNIPYCKLYHVYLMIGSIPEAVEVCRKSREYLEHYKQYLREWKKKPLARGGKMNDFTVLLVGDKTWKQKILEDYILA